MSKAKLNASPSTRKSRWSQQMQEQSLCKKPRDGAGQPLRRWMRSPSYRYTLSISVQFRIGLYGHERRNAFQEDCLLVVHTVAATVMKIICPYVVLVELLCPGNLVDDGPCSGLSWTLLAAPFLGDASAVGPCWIEAMAPILTGDLLDTALEVVVLQGDFEAAGTFLSKNIDPNTMDSCKGRQSINTTSLHSGSTTDRRPPLTTLLWNQKEWAGI
jgi:hypothetical protein